MEKQYRVKGGFNCDRPSKYSFTASTVNYLSSTVKDKDITVVFKEFDDNGNLVEFDSPDASTTSRSDLVMFYNDVPYIVELKERWGRYTSTAYGEEGSEGWMLNVDKQIELTKQNWAIPLYVNLFPDGVIRAWNLNRIGDYTTVTKGIHKTTVMESERITQTRYEVWNKDSKTYKRIEGEPSNGIWTNRS